MADFVGLIPAAGKATRLQGLPKMLLPLPDGYLLKRLIDLMTPCKYIDVLSSASTGDIIIDYAEGQDRGQEVRVPYLQPSPGTYCETILKGTTQHNHLFGMPDTYFEDTGIFLRLKDMLFHREVDVAVGVFKIRPEQRSKLGMVELMPFRHERLFEGQLAITHVLDKPLADEYVNTMSPGEEYAWGVMAWKPTFSKYIYAEDAHLGEALNRAIKDGIIPFAVPMEGRYWDCGTFDEYARLCAYLLEKQAIEVERK